LLVGEAIKLLAQFGTAGARSWWLLGERDVELRLLDQLRPIRKDRLAARALCVRVS
jgi:hypothetical protein